MIRWRYLIVGLTLVATIVAGSGARYLHFDTDYRIWFSDDNPQLQAFETIQNTYTKYDNLLFVLSPASGDVFTRSTLEAVEWLTEQAWQVPYSIRVDSLSNFQHTRGEGDDLVVQDLYTDAKSLTDSELDSLREIALSEPLLRNRLVSGRGHVTGINVTVQPPGVRTDLEVPEIADFARSLKSALIERFPDIDLRMTGIVMMNNAFPEASQHDIQTLIPIMFAVVAVVLGFLTRSLVGTVGTVLLIAFTVVITMGLAGWAGIKLTGASAIAPTIILTQVESATGFPDQHNHGNRVSESESGRCPAFQGYGKSCRPRGDAGLRPVCSISARFRSNHAGKRQAADNPRR